MQRFRSFPLILWLFLLFLPAQAAHGADATSFDPTQVAVKAQGSGGVPVGTIIAWPVATNPEDMGNWLECNGQSISQSVYPELFALVGSKIPDFRGLFLRGYGSQNYAQQNGSNVGVTNTTHTSGALGYIQGDAMRVVWGTMGNHPLKVGSKRNLDSNLELRSGALYREHTWGQSYTDASGRDVGVSFGFNSSRITPTAQEVRPVNMAVRYLVRARP